MKKLFVALAVLFLGLTAHGAQMELLGALNYSNPGSGVLTYTSSTITSTSSTAMTGGGGGLLLRLPAGKAFEFETGAIYTTRAFSYSSTNTTAALVGIVTSNYLEYPLIIRYRFSDFIALGGGVYYAAGIGNTTWTGSSSGVTFGNLQASNNAYESGAVVSLGLNFPLAKTTKFIFDVNYTTSFSGSNYLIGTVEPTPSNSTVTLNAKYTDFMTLVGLSFQL